jgi:transposase
MLCMQTVEDLAVENKLLREKIAHLQEQLEWLRRQIFGKKSEHLTPITNSQQIIIPGCEPKEEKSGEKQAVKPHERAKPNRQGQDKVNLPADLPVERIYIDLPPEQKICQETGKPLIKIGEEVTQKLAVRATTYYIKEIIRPKYAYPQGSDQGIKIAEVPPTLLTRCLADNSFLAELLVKKYADHLPLYRISDILERQGVCISRQLLSQWVLKSAIALKPLYIEMVSEIKKSENVFIDEIPVKMLDPGAGQSKLTYMWVLCGGREQDPPNRAYFFRQNRQHHHAAEILKEVKGFVHSDKYGAYEDLANAKQFTWCPCWAHIRRKFIEAEHGDKNFRDRILEEMQELFKIESLAWEKPPDERLRIRKEQEEPIIDKITEAIKEKYLNGKTLPKSNFREALGYYYSLLPHLKNYMKSAWARLDNNVAERAVRPIAIGRKNWLFVGNNDGGEAAAIILTLVQTCRGLGINPQLYLESVMSQLLDYSNQRLIELLPSQWAKRGIARGNSSL